MAYVPVVISLNYPASTAIIFTEKVHGFTRKNF